MTPIPLEVRPFGFVPASEWSEEQRAKYPVGCRVWATISSARSMKMNSFYWAFVALVAKGIGWDKDSLSDELLIRTGRIDTLKLYANGDVNTQPKRISKMDHATFTAYVDDAIELCLTDYIAMGRKEFLRAAAKMANVTYDEAKAQKDSD